MKYLFILRINEREKFGEWQCVILVDEVPLN